MARGGGRFRRFSRASGGRRRSVRAPRITRGFRNFKLDQVFMKHVFEEPWQNYTGTVAVELSYHLNDMFDPRVAVGGQQPLYFDQMAAQYNEYSVKGCRIKCEVSSNGAIPVEVIIAPGTSNAFPLTTEVQKLKRVLTADVNQGAPVRVVSNYTSFKKVVGVSWQQVQEARGVLGIGSSLLYWITQFTSIDGSQLLDITYRFTLTYYVQWHHPKITLQGGS